MTTLTRNAADEPRYQTQGPTEGYPVVEAWTDEYIRFPPRPPWQEVLRDEIESRCSYLAPSADWVLSATFSGPKPSNADIENLALYNLEAFRNCGRNGIRFEHGSTVPAAPSGAQSRFHYRYALEQRSASFAHWQTGRMLGSFDWVNLGALVGDITTAKVWLSLVRSELHVVEQARAPQTPFAVAVEVRPPLAGPEPRPDLLMKAIVDGTISAFQTHTDRAVVTDVASRLATVLPAPAAEIAEHLLDKGRAVLGEVPQLVRPQRRAGVWNPADDLCVAGELVPARACAQAWAIRGKVFEVYRG